MDESQNKFPKTVISCFAYGGIHWATNACLTRDARHAVATNKQLIFMLIRQPRQDALIDRCRAIVVQRFLRDTDADILIMVDNGIEWKGANKKTGYDGDLWHLAKRAHERQAMEAFYAGSGMTAYPRKLLQDVCNIIGHPAKPGEDLALPACPRCENGFVTTWPDGEECYKCGYPGLK